MPIIASETTSSSIQAPEGTHVAICVYMLEVGHITEEFLGKTKRLHKVRIGWELSNELHEFVEGEGKKPFMVYKDYNISLHEKSTLRQDLVGWRSKEFTAEELKAFDLENILAKPCQVSIVHNEKGYAEVKSVMSIPKGMTIPPQVNAIHKLSYDSWDQEKFDGLPEFLQERMKKSEEYQAMVGGQPQQPTPEVQNTIAAQVPSQPVAPPAPPADEQYHYAKTEGDDPGHIGPPDNLPF